MSNRWSPHPRYRLYTSFASYLPSSSGLDGATERFEAGVCRKFNAAAAVCVPRARTGLYFALSDMIKTKRKVIMSPLTIVDVVNAVLLAGGIPVFADICRSSCSIDPEQAESLIDSQTVAILLTHLHGQTAGARVFREICDRHGIRLIEDAAQAFGAVENGQHLGTIGDAGIYSFGFFKNLSTWRGGMVVSNDQEFITRLRNRVHKLPRISRSRIARTALAGLLVDLGTWPPFFSQVTHRIIRSSPKSFERRLDPERRASRLKDFPESYWHRMREWQACLGLAQLHRVDSDTNARLAHARRYHEALDGVPQFVKPERTDDRSNIYTYFPIQVRDRNTLVSTAQKRGRDFGVQHLRNCADLSEFAELYRDCPNARAAASELVLLPTYPRYPAREVELNIEVVREFASIISESIRNEHDTVRDRFRSARGA